MSDKGKQQREIEGSREQIITELTQKYDITSNVLKRTDRNQIASVKAKKQDSKKFLRFCGNYTTLYIHTSEWLKLPLLLQLLQYKGLGM